MPSVPYSPVPTVEPAQGGPGPLSVATPIEAFGGATAKAVQGLGAQLGHVGDELFSRAIAIQQLNNDAAATEADTAYMMLAGKRHAEYNALEGKARVDAYDGYVKGLEDDRAKVGSGLSNPMSRRMFDKSSRGTMGRTVFNGAGAAASAQKDYVRGASLGNIDAVKQRAFEFPNSEPDFLDAIQRTVSEIRTKQAVMEGWSPEKTNMEVNKAVSELYRVRTEGLAQQEPFKAREFLDKSRPFMREQDYERAFSKVQGQEATIGAKLIAQEVTQGVEADAEGNKKSLTEMQAEARDRAAKLSPNNKLLGELAVSAVDANYNRAKTAHRDEQWTASQTIDKSLSGSFSSSGKLPTTIDELLANPEAQQAWQRLDEDKKRAKLNALRQNAKGERAWTEASTREALRLKGMAENDATLLEFMNTDVMSLDMPLAGRRSLAELQIRKKKNAEQDPQVTHALGVLRPMLAAANVNIKDNPAFVGALQDAISTFQQREKHGPKAEDINLIGARLLQEQPDPNKWLSGVFGRTSRAFELTAPEAEAEKIRRSPYWSDNNIKPDDEMVNRVYRRKLYETMNTKKKPNE